MTGRSRFRRVVAGIGLLVALAPCACGWKCPTGSQSGSCDLSNTALDPGAQVTALKLTDNCDYVPRSSCSGNPGYTCTLGGGEQHRFGYAVIGDQQGWDKLAATWGTGCTPTGVPTSWTDTFVILAAMSATEATASSVSHAVFRQSNGTPLVTLDFAVTYEEGCDCAELAAVGLVIKSSAAPGVCLKVKSQCE